MDGFVHSPGVLQNPLVVFSFLIDISPRLIAFHEHLGDRAAKALPEHMLNDGLVLHELIVSHLRIQSPSAPNFRPRFAGDMGQLMDFENIQIIGPCVTLIDSEVNAMPALFESRITVH